MKKLAIICGFLLSFAAFSQNHALDKTLKTCLDSAMNTVTMTEYYDKAVKVWDKELNSQYQELMAKITNTKQKNKFRDAQRQWIAYRNAWLTAAKNYYYDTQGTMAPLSVGEQQVTLIKNQAKLLASMNEQ